MRRIIPIVAALLCATAAWGADNAVIVTPGTGVTMKSKDIGAGVQSMQPILSDTGGNALSMPTAGADGASNTATGLLSYARPSWWNGATWDRAPGDATNGAFVNVKTSVLPTGAATAANQATEIASLATIATNTGAAIPAGSALIGKVGIDQTTPGTTNLVALAANQSINEAQINGVTPLMGNGASGTGSQRVNLSNDNTAIANWGQGATAAVVPSGAQYQGANVGGNLTGSIKCGSSAVYDASTNGSTQLVAISGSTKIYVCGYTIFSAGTVNVELDYGTGSACATGNTKIVPAYQLTAQTGVVDVSPEFRGLATIASQALCLKTSAGVAVQAIVYYTQF